MPHQVRPTPTKTLGLFLPIDQSDIPDSPVFDTTSLHVAAIVDVPLDV